MFHRAMCQAFFAGCRRPLCPARCREQDSAQQDTTQDRSRNRTHDFLPFNPLAGSPFNTPVRASGQETASTVRTNEVYGMLTAVVWLAVTTMPLLTGLNVTALSA